MRALRARHKAAQEAERKHLQICAQCGRIGADVLRRCDDGWELAKAELRARRAIEYYGMDHPDNQETMF